MAIRQPDYIIIGGGRTSAGASQSIISEEPAGTKNGSNVTFTLSFPPSPCAGQSPAFALLLYLNGIRQSPYANGSGDYSLNGNIITYAEPPLAGQQHEAFYFVGASAGTLPGRARFFNSSSASVDYGNADLYRISGDVSFGCWVQFPSNAQGLMVSQGKAFTVDAMYEFAVTGSSGAWNLAYLHAYNSNGSTENHTFTANVQNDLWRYVGFSRDTFAKTVKAYLRTGASMSLLGTFSYTNNPNAGLSSAAHLQIGNYFNGPGNVSFEKNFIGKIQEHYLSSRTGPWSSDEHLATSNGNPPTDGLVLSCPMGNTPELDTSGNGGVGAVTGTTLVQGHS